MKPTLVVRRSAAVASFALAALVAASWGGWALADEQPEPAPLAGPAVSFYVVDHAGAQPDRTALAPYEAAFRRLRRGCTMNAVELASVVFQMSDQASMGSGVNVDNLRVLQGLVREMGPTKADCNEAFFRAEARLEGSALG